MKNTIIKVSFVTYWVSISKSPNANSSNANNAFNVNSDGNVIDRNAYDDYAVLPVVYLTSNVGVQSGDGSLGNPFILS